MNAAMLQHAGPLSSGSLPMLLGGGLCMLVCFFASGLLLLRGNAREQELSMRLARVSTLYAPTRAVRPQRSAALRDVLRLDERGAALLRLLGYESAKRSHYPLPPWAVLAATFLVGYVQAFLMQKVVGPAAFFDVPVAGLLLARLFWKWCDGRRKRKLYMQLPDALAMIVRAVRVGVPLTESFNTIAREAEAPTSEEFGRLADRIRIGVALDDALAEQSARVGLPEYRFFATALTLQAQTGGGLTETLENLADVIRKRIALRNRAHALASEARTSAIILGILPVFTMGVLSVVNFDYVSTLFTTSAGNLVLLVAAGMLSTGALVMRTIIVKSLT